jgi:uncharacterized protein YcgI (DUF1989 family)
VREEGKEIETDTVGLKKRVFVPAREGRGVGLRAGERFRVVDLEGMQAGDLFAFNANDSSEYASAEHTRVYAKTPEEARNCRLFPRVGGYFVTNRREPILYFEEDHSPGQHDMLVAACDAKRYELLGYPGHDSCVENLKRVMAEFGYEDVEIPQPINFFANFPVHGDGTFTQELLQTKPGDYVTLRAEMDAIVVLSACPHDVLPVYGPMGPTSMAIEVLTDA